MAYVISRLCRDCVDAACVEVCPVDCIVEHRPTVGSSHLPNQLFIDPAECINCNRCVAECPWEAIYDEHEIPDEFREDIALNALSAQRSKGFHVPVERLREVPSREQVDANKRRWGLSRG